MRYLRSILLILLFPSSLIAQEQTNSIETTSEEPVVLLTSGTSVPNQNIFIPSVPPSPQAVAFNRLGDFQLDNNYGVPDINIPLFEIDFHGYKIPLTLHYEATPIKSGYNYDVTGLGWTLSGNSCVSRTINGRADEYGLFGNHFMLDSFFDLSGHLRRYMDYSDNLSQMNFQYDTYNIVLPSGRTIPFFMYKYNGVMNYDLLSHDSHVVITCSYTSSQIDAFTVKDENGVTYNFTVADRAANIYENDANAFRNVTWLLTSIVIPSKGAITYEYTPLQTFYASTVDEPVLRVSRLMSQMSGDINELGYHLTNTSVTQCPRYSMRFLSRICYGPTVVDFNYAPDGAHMNGIVVSDNGEAVREFSLNINGSALTALTVSGQDGDDVLRYGFTYTNNAPGGRTDYWGNRCNSSASTDIGNFNMFIDKSGIDRTSLQTQLAYEGNLAQLINNDADDLISYYKIKLQSTTNGDTRQPTSPDYHEVLSSITYPNGGRTTFIYENHRFLTATAADGDLVFNRRSQRIIEGGGFRIKSIKNWTANGDVANEEHFRYGFRYGDIVQSGFPLPLPTNYNTNDHIGCGEAVVDPNLLTFMAYSYSPYRAPTGFLKMLVGLHSGFENITVGDGGAWWWDAYFSARTFRALLGNRRPVVYPEITVYHGLPYYPDQCKGKTVYKYDIYSFQHYSDTYYMSSFQQTALPDTAYIEPVSYNYGSGAVLSCMEFPSKRHKLQSVSDYSYNTDDGTWELVSEESYSHYEDFISKSGYIFDSYVSRGHCYRHTLQYGAGRQLESFNLNEFYKSATQRLGKSVITGKSTTKLRHGGNRDEQNTLTESWQYLYTGVIKSRDYTDVWGNHDEHSYVGGVSATSDDVITQMKARNMLAYPLSVETTTELSRPSIIRGSKIDYAFFGNDIHPYKLYENNGNTYEETLQIISYDSYGNPTEMIDLRTGLHTVFLWDTYGRYMTAMIVGAELSQVQNAASITGTSRTRHASLRSLLPNAQIQTWDYKPLVGVSAYTDNSGKTMLYEYDGLGRLKTESRMLNGATSPEVLHEYEYNYVNE